MAKNKNKYYVVWVGKTPGVYSSWKDCQAQISGFPNAKYKGFPDKTSAEAAFRQTYDSHYSEPKSKGPRPHYRDFTDEIQLDSISVDAACSGNPGVLEYQGVLTETGERIFHQGPFADGTNNIGEFLAIVHALALFEKQGRQKQVIYTDSRTAMSWVRNKRVKTQLKQTRWNAVLFALIERAENWLKTQSWDHTILKWNTEKWGEIPADFGRK